MATKTFLGIKPFSFQRDVINELKDANGTGKNVVVVSRRQVGKTTLIINLLLYYAVNFARTKNYCISPTVKQCKGIFKTIIDTISNSGLIKSKNATELIITLINGSSIIFKSAEQKEALRGETCTGLLCIDESAYISDDIFNIIRPYTDFHKAVTLIVSTPFAKSGFFYRYYNYGVEGTNNTVSINWSDKKYQEDLDKILSPEQLEEYRRILPRNVFSREYLGEFIDAEGSVFTDFKKCIRVNQIQPTDKLYVGIDWGSGNGNDDTVVCAFNQYGKMVLLKYFNTISPTEQIDRIDRILSPYLKQTVLIQPELNGLGGPMTDMLKNRSQIYAQKVRGFNTTNDSKKDLVTDLQVAFEQGKVELLDDEKLINQLSIFTAEYNIKTGNVSFAAPPGLNDDCTMATMIAYNALKTATTVGVYSIGFYRR